MTDKITKELAKLATKERTLLREILQCLQAGQLAGLGIAKLKGHDNIFRVRKGRLRIIYQQSAQRIKVLAIERRSEKTYRDF